MHRHNKFASLLLVFVSIFLFSGITPPDWLNRSIAGLEEQTGAPDTLVNSVYLPFVLDLHPWSNPMAVETHNPIVDGGLLATRMDELNNGWVRLSGRVSWRQLQPNENDPINWSLLANFENELRVLKQMGVEPVVVIQDSPYWATKFPTSCSAVRADKFSAYASFLAQIVAHFKAPEFDVHDWELGNEPDVDPDIVPIDSIYGCWGDIDDPNYGGGHYGEMLKYAAPSIRNEDSRARIWIGGMVLSTPNTTIPNMGKPELFLKGILEAGAAPYFDIVAFHGHTQYYDAIVDSELYLSGPWNEWGGGVRGKVRYLREMMARYNVDKPLVINEIGVGCRYEIYEFCDEEKDIFFEFQADMLIRIASRVLADDVKGFTWYTLEGPGWRYHGLLNQDYTLKPAFIAYQEMISQITKTSYMGEVNYGSDLLEGYAFQRGSDEFTQILWTKENITTTITVPQVKLVSARIRQGLTIVDAPVVPVGADYQITVGFSPIFITIRP